MSWLFSRALVAAFLRGTSSDGAPSAQLSMTPTARPFLRNDKPMDCSRFSRFGLTCEPLTADLGEELLTWFRAAFHVRTSASPGQEMASTAHVADCGWRWQGSFAKYDRATSTWRTRQHSLLGDLDEFSGTWPRWGSMRDGESSAHTIAARRIFASESGLLPTPAVCQRDNQGGAQDE